MDGSKQSTNAVGEGFRINEPQLRPEAADIGDGRGESDAKAPSGRWTIRAAGTEKRSGDDV